MPNSNSPSVITLNFRPIALRWLLILPALLALFCAWSAIRWYVGNTLAEYAPPSEEGGIEMARVAVRWAPNDPLTHWRLASFEEKNFSAENMARAIREYEIAVKISPNDYRYWMELGRTAESIGDTDKAEKALRRAVELAPAYSHPRWHYGNMLVRQGRIDEGFAQLTLAAEADDAIRPQVMTLASQVFAGDVIRISSTLRSPRLRLNFALGLINTNKFDDANRVLQTTSAADRKTHRDVTEEIFKAFMTQKRFRSALSMLRELEPGAELPTAGQMWNGGFESAITVGEQKPFQWWISANQQAQISIDSRSHSGGAGLRIVFKAPSKLAAIPLSLTVIVEPDTQYRMQYYQRSDNLLSGATPSISINDAVDGAALALSPAMAPGTNDWQLVTLDFKTKPDHDGISISIIRGSCNDNEPVCPIFGTVWYDDFNLQRIGGPGVARRGPGGNTP